MKPIPVGIKWYLLCGSEIPYIYNMMMHGKDYLWNEETLGWTTAVVYNLLSGFNIESFKAKSYLNQGEWN